MAHTNFSVNMLFSTGLLLWSYPIKCHLDDFMLCFDFRPVPEMQKKKKNQSSKTNATTILYCYNLDSFIVLFIFHRINNAKCMYNYSLQKC